MGWYLLCNTCPVRIEINIRYEGEGEWHLKYHRDAYPNHDVRLTATPKRKRKRANEVEKDDG